MDISNRAIREDMLNSKREEEKEREYTLLLPMNTIDTAVVAGVIGS